jgi:hypothetical protein
MYGQVDPILNAALSLTVCRTLRYGGASCRWVWRRGSPSIMATYVPGRTSIPRPRRTWPPGTCHCMTRWYTRSASPEPGAAQVAVNCASATTCCQQGDPIAMPPTPSPALPLLVAEEPQKAIEHPESIPTAGCISGPHGWSGCRQEDQRDQAQQAHPYGLAARRGA